MLPRYDFLSSSSFPYVIHHFESDSFRFGSYIFLVSLVDVGCCGLHWNMRYNDKSYDVTIHLLTQFPARKNLGGKLETSFPNATSEINQCCSYILQYIVCIRKVLLLYFHTNANSCNIKNIQLMYSMYFDTYHLSLYQKYF